MKAHTTLAAASLVLASLLGACSPPADTAAPDVAAAPAVADNPDIHPFRIGALEAVALKDGELVVPNDNKVLGVGRTPQEVSALLTAAGQPGDKLSLTVDPLLIRDGDRLVLIDTGAGGQMGSPARLPASLAAAGVRPDQVTDILLSHAHPDHIGGLVNAAGGLNFPNAAVRMSGAEWTFLQGQAEAAAVARAIAPKVQTFQPGAVVAPNITAVAINGHTPGHVGYEIASGADTLLYIGDAMHHSVVSVQRPDWPIAFDSDSAAATASRKALLQRAAAENLRLYAVHFPYPNLGRIQTRGEGYVWVPES